MKLLKKTIITLIPFLLLASCEYSSADINKTKEEYEGNLQLIVSYSNPTRFCILYKNDFSGNISYITSKTDLNIKTADEFNASTATKKDVTVLPDALNYNNYILTDSLAAATKYYIYLLNKLNGEVKSLIETTGQNLGSTQVPGTSGILTYNINLPYGYDAAGSKTWPLLVSLKAPNMTASNNNFPCITINAGIDGGSEYGTKISLLRTVIADIVSTYKVDKSRVYGIGYSAGGCAIVEIANNDGSAAYQFKAIAVTGISSFLTSSNCGNMGNVNSLLYYGSIDTTTNPGTEDVHNKFVSLNGTGEHILIEMSGLDHNTSYNPPWESPYTFTWLLSK